MSTVFNQGRMTIQFGDESQRFNVKKSNLFVVDIFNFDGECEHVEVMAKNFAEATEHATAGLNDVSYCNVYLISINN